MAHHHASSMSHTSDMDMDPGHGGGSHAAMCSMNMLFTWDTENLCIVFRSWRVTGLWSLLGSLAAVVVLTAGYEAVREAARRSDARHRVYMASLPRAAGPSPSAEEQKGKIVRAAFYGVQVFYSFFIMLLFMTYNGWIMISVGVGAFIGYLVFSGSPATKSAACH